MQRIKWGFPLIILGQLCLIGCQGGFPSGSIGECRLVPTAESLGVYVDQSGSDIDRIELRYKGSSDSSWKTGHPMARIPNGKNVGSIFFLQPNTSYSVETVGVNANGEQLDNSLCQATTKVDLPTTQTANTYYVQVTALTGGNGSSLFPFKTIQEGLNVAQAGDKVIVKAGTYHENLYLQHSGSEVHWIQIIGEAGATLNGSDPTVQTNGLTWFPQGTPNVYQASYSGTPTAIWRGIDHFYRYDDLNHLKAGMGHKNVPISEGWFQSASTLYVRSLSSPSGFTWHIPDKGAAFFSAPSIQYNWIEGFDFKYYDGTAVYIAGSSHIVVRGNVMEYCRRGLWIDGVEGTQTTLPGHHLIENNQIYDSKVDEWGYDAGKATSHETSGIMMGNSEEGIIIRYNQIGHFFNGISISGATDTDIYENTFDHFADDGLEPDGTGTNLRFWRNSVNDAMSALSMSPLDQGPIWILYNRFTNFSTKGVKSAPGEGVGFLYHNTFWSMSADGALIDPPAVDHSTYVYRNNIGQVNVPIYGFTDQRYLANLDSDYNNFTSTVTTPYHLTSSFSNYYTQTELCSAKGLECNSTSSDPMLEDPINGKFGLMNGSPSIDTGLFIPGINDTHKNPGPDIGFNELGDTAF